MSPRPYEITCPICRRNFRSWPALRLHQKLFGH